MLELIAGTHILLAVLLGIRAYKERSGINIFLFSAMFLMAVFKCFMFPVTYNIFLLLSFMFMGFLFLFVSYIINTTREKDNISFWISIVWSLVFLTQATAVYYAPRS